MRLFVDVQKVSEAGRRVTVSVPASKALVLTNKTKAPILIFHEQGAKVGYPLEIQESLEVETVTETCDFFVELLDTEIGENEGLFIVSQTEMMEGAATTNNIVINQQKTT